MTYCHHSKLAILTYAVLVTGIGGWTPVVVGVSSLPGQAQQARDSAGEPSSSRAVSDSKELTLSRKPHDAADYCENSNFKDLYAKIPELLRYWNESGISPNLMNWTATEAYQHPALYKGAGVLFKDGKPYIITDPSMLSDSVIAHHKRLVASHFALFLAMAKTFGKAIPDVEFVFTTADEPSALLAHFENGTDPERLPPFFSFCKSKFSHADILIPDIHFFLRNFTSKLLYMASNFTETWPWKSRKGMLFGRFSPYPRIASAHAPELYRRGRRGKNICRPSLHDQWFCDVRKHYIWEWAKGANRSGAPLDIAQQPKRDMLYHASHKWLLHLDGQTCSSRLEQLLVLGSLVLKEESGYEAFFHHLLKPYRHYVPIWKKVPEETKWAIAWAQKHDKEAAAIGQAAQQFALRYLHKRALMCYWFKLLKEFSKLLRYKPGSAARPYRYTKPVEEWMQDTGWRELERHHIAHMEFWD